jgi:hypothetical protein
MKNVWVITAFEKEKHPRKFLVSAENFIDVLQEAKAIKEKFKFAEKTLIDIDSLEEVLENNDNLWEISIQHR